MASFQSTSAASNVKPKATREPSSSRLSSLSDSYKIVTSSLLDVKGFPNATAEPFKEAISRVSLLLDYNVPHGKQFRGNAVVSTFKTLKPDATHEEILDAHAVGWSLELAQAAFLVTDDMMDGSETRRGNVCWYKVPGVGTSALNDILMLQNSVYFILDRFVKKHPSYDHITSLMLDMVRKTCIGQVLDTQTNGPGQVIDLNMYTMERYFNIVLYKTAFYTVSHPVRLGLYLAGFNDPVLHAEAEAILLKMGEFFQIQDDFLDVFGDPAVTGKVGTDIIDGKCSWPIVTALEKASPVQRQLLEKHYGVKDDKSVQEVKNIFKELCIEGDYRTFEKSEHDLLKKQIAVFCEKRRNTAEWRSEGFPESIFLDFLNKLFGRRA